MKDQYLLCYNYAVNQNPAPYVYFKHGRLWPGVSAQGGDAILTVGSSTTVSAANNLSPFAGSQVGDLLIMYKGDPALNPTPDIVHITAVTSPNQVTVDTAVNWSNGGVGFTSWFSRTFWSGTAVTSGWIQSSKYSQINVEFMAGTVQATGGLDFSIEIRGLGPDPAANQNIPVLQGNFPAAATVSANYVVTEIAPFIRVGLRAHTTAQAGESVTVKIVGVWDPYSN